jgi:hypothetical protein
VSIEEFIPFIVIGIPCKIFKKTKSQNIYSGGKKPKLILVLKSPEISFSLFDFFSHNFQF